MIKRTVLITSALLLVNGCVIKETIIKQPVPKQETKVVYYQAEQPVVETSIVQISEEIPSSAVELRTENFTGQTLTATAEVSQLVDEIKTLNNNTADININSNQNIKVGAFLNIEATPSQAGYFKIIIIDPNGKRSLALPNSISRGYLKANQRFYSNNGQFALKATNPKGLHYVVTIFSEKNARLIVKQGENGRDAIYSDQDFINILNQINNQEYGRSHISVFPMRIY